MSTRSSPFAPPRSVTALGSAIADWARTDGLTWVYIFKVLAACFLALGIAMELDLPQPRTAMITVFIVMQPQTGMVLAKSFYRICGTLVGLIVTLVLVSLFSQQPEMFIVSTSIWVGICTAGAARNRNFKSYGFVLAGYTAALIGIPAAQHPDSAFIGALTRVAEVVLGIVSSGLVSALVFPRHMGDQLPVNLRDRFAAFAEYASAALAGRVDRVKVETINARFVADIVGFESLRSAAVFDSPDVRMRRSRLARLNQEFMTLSTRFYALYQLMNRLRDTGKREATRAMELLQPYSLEISLLLAEAGDPAQRSMDAIEVSEQLNRYGSTLRKRLCEARTSLGGMQRAGLLDFDTGVELLCRFVYDLCAYTATYASLSSDTHQREQWVERYEPKTNLIAASVSGLRTVLLAIVVGAFWIETASPSGLTLTVAVSTVAALISSSPNPKRAAFQMAVGAVLSSVAGMLVVFGVYPYIDGFPLLCVALAPFLLIGVLMTIRPKLASCGVGYCIFFSFQAGPDNVIHYDPSAFMNDALALIVAMLVTTVAFAVLLPPSTPWLRNRMLIDLRRQVGLATRAGMRRVRSHFESGARDLAFQINALAPAEPELKRDTLRWLLLVLEVGNAAIDLRKEMAALSANARYAKSTPLHVSLRAVLDAVSALFDAPRTERFDHAIGATTDAIVAIQQILASATPPDRDRRCLQDILCQLHLFHIVLLDSQSPLGQLMTTRVIDIAGVGYAR